jgi:hypothetical protein
MSDYLCLSQLSAQFYLAISRLSDLFLDEYKLICEMGIIMGIYLQTLTLRVGIRV